MKITQEQFDDAIEKATDAFWESIIKSFPQIKTGDLSFNAVISLDEEMRMAVEEWIHTNLNKKRNGKANIISS